MALPSTLQEAIVYFADPKNCNEFLAGLRWTDGKVKCPYCGSERVIYLEKQNRYKCYGKHPKAQFSLKVGTIFEDSPYQSRQVALCDVADRELQERHQFLRDRPRSRHHSEVRLVHGSPHPVRAPLRFIRESCPANVEADETFIGGKARNMHVAKRQRRITGTGGKDKTAVMGILERGGRGSH